MSPRLRPSDLGYTLRNCRPYRIARTREGEAGGMYVIAIKATFLEDL